MGSQQSQLNRRKKHYNLINYGYCQVWQRKEDGQQYLEQYNIIIDDQETLSKYQEMHQLRTNHPRLVNICYFAYEDSKQSINSLCGMAKKVMLLTERIPVRINQCQRAPFGEYLYILKNMLEGYRLLCADYGLFYVNSNMVGINNDWQFRIWHHTDFSSPTPQNPHCKSYKSMIKSIIIAAEKILSCFDRKINFSEFISGCQERQQSYLQCFQAAIDGFNHYVQLYNYQPVYSLADSKNKLTFRNIWQNSSSSMSNSNIRLYNPNDANFSFKNDENSFQTSKVSRLSSKDPQYTLTKQSQFKNQPKSIQNLNSYICIPHDNRFFPLSLPIPYQKTTKISFSSQTKQQLSLSRYNSQKHSLYQNTPHYQQTPVAKLNNQYYSTTPYTLHPVTNTSLKNNNNQQFQFMKQTFGKPLK